MSKTKIDRRNFLKVLGLGTAGVAMAGCDMPSYVTSEEGVEKVYSYLAPEEYVIPGIGVWYASTCQQCPQACGIHGRVREGRVLKLEGNPDNAVSVGKICQMGQAGIQTHFHPERIQNPTINGKQATWDEALALVKEKTSNASWVTGTVSGHQRVLMDSHREASGSGRHYAVEVVNARAWEDASAAVLGDAHPNLHIDKARAILSIGADFLGTWGNPVKSMRDYGNFRNAPRGVLMTIEPAMSMTGASSDTWVAARPGSEAAVVLGIGYVLANKHGVSAAGMPSAAAAFAAMTPARVLELSGVTEVQLNKIADTLMANSPSLVLANASHAAAKAAQVLNLMLGNVGQTITPGATMVGSALAPLTGSSKDLAEFAMDANAGKIGAVFITGTNPSFLAPKGLDMGAALSKIGFKVAIADFADETTKACDVVLPMSSPLESWGTHVPTNGGTPGMVNIQQPLMENVYANTRGLGDILLSVAKGAGVNDLDGFEDYYGYLRTAVSAMIGSDRELDWNKVLQSGSVTVENASSTFTSGGDVALSYSEPAKAGTLSLITSARQGLFDGRHANLPWMQEAPDQISKAVWDSWAEIHPKTAEKLGVKDGDYISINTANGAINTRVFTYKGIHQDAINVPMGRGHTDYGPYAQNGVNPLFIMDATSGDRASTELLTSPIAATVTPTGENRHLVRLMDVDSQHGRKLIATITADQFSRNQGGA